MDESGRGGPSAMAAALTFSTFNCVTIRLGELLAVEDYQLAGPTSSLEPWSDMYLEYWDIETPRYTLRGAPGWLACDPLTGLISGAPDAAGIYAFQALAEIENHGACVQSLAVIVLPTNPPALNNMVGDYDGDGIAEAVWPLADGGIIRVWLSSQDFRRARDIFEGEWNASAVFAAGDYDGDRRADPAMYDPGAGRWTVLLSSAGYASFAFNFGGPGWQPAPGDYDGDGRSDLACYHEMGGAWQVRLSGANWQAVDFKLGGQGWQPACADYDGDRRMDPSVRHPASGRMIALLSAAGYAAFAPARY